MADILIYHCLGPRFCDAPFGFLKKEIMAGNVYAFVLFFLLVIGSILFLWAEINLPDPSHNDAANKILFWYCFVVILLALLMNFYRKTSVSSPVNNLTTNYAVVRLDDKI